MPESHDVVAQPGDIAALILGMRRIALEAAAQGDLRRRTILDNLALLLESTLAEPAQPG